MGELTREAHIERHKQLYRMLDELVADYVSCTSELLSETSVMDFLKWSYEQMLNPTEPDMVLVAGFVPDGSPERMHAESAQEITVQAIRVGAALVLRIRRGSDLLLQRVLGPREECELHDPLQGSGPIVVNGAEVRVRFNVRNREGAGR